MKEKNKSSMTPRTEDVLTLGKSRKYYSLSWNDMQDIDNIISDMTQHIDYPVKAEVFYGEVLKRFLDGKERH